MSKPRKRYKWNNKLGLTEFDYLYIIITFLLVYKKCNLKNRDYLYDTYTHYLNYRLMLKQMKTITKEPFILFKIEDNKKENEIFYELINNYFENKKDKKILKKESIEPENKFDTNLKIMIFDNDKTYVQLLEVRHSDPIRTIRISGVDNNSYYSTTYLDLLQYSPIVTHRDMHNLYSSRNIQNAMLNRSRKLNIIKLFEKKGVVISIT